MYSGEPPKSMLTFMRDISTTITEEEKFEYVTNDLFQKIFLFRLIPGIESPGKLCTLIPGTSGVTAKNNKKPIILDIGCDTSCSYYYAMIDYFTNFTYIGFDLEQPSVFPHANLHAFQGDLRKQEPILSKIKDITGAEKVDLVLLEDLATRDADNTETNQLLQEVIQKFIPAVLAESGSFHIGSASEKQDKIITDILIAENIDFIRVHNHFLCGEAALIDEIISTIEKSTQSQSNVLFNINKPPKHQKAEAKEQKQGHSPQFFTQPVSEPPKAAKQPVRSPSPGKSS